MENLRTDAILMEILTERKTITGFLDSVFGFLRRNTDFYHIKQDSSEQIGFPKGMREQILFGTMQRYDPECKLNSLATEDDGGSVPPAVEEIEIESQENVDIKNQTNIKLATEDCVKTFEAFALGDHHNGACFDNYCWSQTLKDIELHVKLPEHFKTSRVLSIVIQTDTICVKSKSNPNIILLGGTLSNKCKHHDAVWTIAEGKLLINIDKIKEIWWEKLFINEPAIDVRKIDCERYIDELPEESQAVIEKLRVDQMKQDSVQARYTSKTDNETLEKLRKAWDADGSPFRGQPFDPSIVQFN